MNKFLAIAVGLLLTTTAAHAQRDRGRDDGDAPRYQEPKSEESSQRGDGGQRAEPGSNTGRGPRGFSGPRAAYDTPRATAPSYYNESSRETERLSGGGSTPQPAGAGYGGGRRDGGNYGGRDGGGQQQYGGRDRGNRFDGRDGRYGGDDRNGRHGGGYDDRHGGRNDRYRNYGGWDGRDHGRHGGRGHGRHNNWRHGAYWGSYRPHHRYRSPWRYSYPRGYYASAWNIGIRLPHVFFSSPRYYVDYRPYGLAPPPYGYEWVRVDSDVLLVEIATGIIVDIVEGLYY